MARKNILDNGAISPKLHRRSLAAALYLNNKRRDRFLPAITQGEEWALKTWYKSGDTVLYNEVLYRCIQTHQAIEGIYPDVEASVYWVAEE